MINDLEALPEPFILTIDDYHTIHDEVVLRRGQKKITLQLPHNLILKTQVEEEDNNERAYSTASNLRSNGLTMIHRMDPWN